jgi:hypothetical protein
VGESLLRLFRFREKSMIVALVLAVILWTLIKFVPGLSVVVHLLILILSIGVTLTTRFGTGTPWFRRLARNQPSAESA